MDDTTDTLTRPDVALPPPPGSSPAPWPGQISQAAPTLPSVAPAVPRPANVDTSPFATAMFMPQEAPTVRRPKRPSAFRRLVSWLLLLGVLGGLVYAGIVYGPDLMDRATGSETTDEPSAPLVFPMPITAPTPIRTASFVVSEPDPFGGTQEYEVTTDFESGVAHVVIPRTGTPNLEVLTVWDQAFIRRIDEPTWYSLPRGDFPIDNSLGRARWVRTLDELFPPAIRQYTTIVSASESAVGTEPARRLVVSADAARLLQAQNATLAAPADGSAGAPPALPPGVTIEPGVDGVEDFEVEIWVDDAGIVRKSVLPESLGGETITVTSVSADAWEPTFPTPDVVQPLTAQALFRLGI